MNIDWSNPTIIAAVIAGLGTIIGGIIAAIAIIKSRTKVHNEITLLDAQKGRKRTKIKEIRGTDSNIGMRVTIENHNSFPMQVLSEQGTVINTGNPGMQKMVAARPQVFSVSPDTIEEFDLDALCLEPFKDPPRSTGEGNHKIGGVTRNGEVLKLFRTIKSIEDEISSKIVSVQGDGFQARSMSEDLSELAKVCQYSRGRIFGYESKIIDHIVQCALWQVTDKLDFDSFAKILRANTHEEKNRLREVAKFAAIILKRAEIDSTIH